MTQPPTWDLSAWFPGLDSEAWRVARGAVDATLADLKGRAIALAPPVVDDHEAWVALLRAVEAARAELGHLDAFAGALAAADAHDPAAKRETAALASLGARSDQVEAALIAGLGAAEAAAFEALIAHPDLEGAAYRLRRLRDEAARSMSPELEMLAAELGVTGLDAWGRLYEQVTGELDFELTPGRRVPFAWKRSLTQDPDPAIRRAALVNSNAELAARGSVFTAALNGIAGTRLALWARRGIPHFLDEAVHGAAITRATLDTMMGVCAEYAELPRRYLRLKAGLMGMERLGMQDLSAPVPVPDPPPLPWAEATRIVLDAFDRYDPEMGDFARHALAHRWIEAEPRPGKRPGAFCTGSRVARESRVFMTYQDTLGDVQTLAHELGHAYHNFVMRDLRPFATGYAMTLAETASTFAESLVGEALLAAPGAGRSQTLAVLDLRMDRAASFLLNIPMRFEFERAFYEARREGEVPTERLCALMEETQRAVYGDALDPQALDPWFWASKLHYFITGVSFYNFPYTFGYLFSLGVWARARSAGPAFRPTYRALLRATGSGTAEQVARDVLGIDLERPEFWRETMTIVADDLALFEQAIAPPA